MHRRKKGFAKGAVPLVIMAALFLVVLDYDHSYAAKTRQETFTSPQAAVKAMVDAMKAADTNRLLAVFGPDSKELFSSGDDATDRQVREEFVKAYEEKNRLETVGKKKVVLHVGKEDWAWPIPIVSTGQRWRFDTKAGRQEILARRIGANELAVIQVCLAYADAQREYAESHYTGGIMEYAQKFVSDAGTRDGLCCWSQKGSGENSPLGPLVGNACKASYEGAGKAGTPQPYHGYFYKIIKKQGQHAPGGEADYVVNGKMIGGFALVAYPAHYASSGIMTFIINQDGVVYEKDLGKTTEKRAEEMDSFNPDETWQKVE